MKRNEWKQTESRKATRTGSDSGKVSTINSKRKKDGTDETEDKIYVQDVNPPYKGEYTMRLVWGDRAFYMTKRDAIRLAAKIVEAAV